MGLTVYNTLTRRKEAFEPVTPGKVGIYLCGPTVYRPSHIGHAVGPIIFDAIKRYLVHCGYDVTLVVNITDVDDKLIDEAAEQNTTTAELAERISKDYLDAMAELHVDAIDIMPKASEHIGDIISIVERLIDRGVAYQSGGDVYFDISKHPGYGKLSNRRVDEQEGQRDGQAGGTGGGQVRFPVGIGSTRMAHRVLGDVHTLPGRYVRHPRRRAGPRLSPP
jgi:cysteinyl-tRNA synthetase